MKLIEDTVSLKELQSMAGAMFGDLVKAVVDIDRRIMALDAELHADQEAVLLDQGSSQKSLWGINLYPELFGTTDFIEFDSMINLRPSQGNMSRGVDDLEVQQRICDIVKDMVKP